MKHALGMAFADAGLSAREVARRTGFSESTVRVDLNSSHTVSDNRLRAYADLLGVSLDRARELSPRPVPIVAASLLRERRWTSQAFAESRGINASALRCVLSGQRQAGPRVAAILEDELGLPAEVLTAPDDSGDR